MRAGVEQSTRRDVKCQHEHISLVAREFRFATCKINWQFLKLTFASFNYTFSTTFVISSPWKGIFFLHTHETKDFCFDVLHIQRIRNGSRDTLRFRLLGSDSFPAVVIYKLWVRREGNDFFFCSTRNFLRAAHELRTKLWNLALVLGGGEKNVANHHESAVAPPPSFSFIGERH